MKRTTRHQFSVVYRSQSKNIEVFDCCVENHLSVFEHPVENEAAID